MELGKKTLIAGLGLFLLGGFSVYLVMAEKSDPARGTVTSQSAIAQQATATPEINSADIASQQTAGLAEEATHESFIAAAEARREQQMANKAEEDRLAKLRKEKSNTVECKFWKQQQERQTSSTAAKIAANIDEHCVIAQDRLSSDSNSSVISG